MAEEVFKASATAQTIPKNRTVRNVDYVCGPCIVRDWNLVADALAYAVSHGSAGLQEHGCLRVRSSLP